MSTGAGLTLRASVASVISEHIVFELEAIDRVYLNVYMPRLQREVGVTRFFRFHRRHLFASGALMDPIKDFAAQLERFAKQQRVSLMQFRKGKRKDDVEAKYLKELKVEEGVLLIGNAQEATQVFRTERRHGQKTERTYP